MWFLLMSLMQTTIWMLSDVSLPIVNQLCSSTPEVLAEATAPPWVIAADMNP